MSMGIKETVIATVAAALVLKVLDWAGQFLPSNFDWLGASMAWLWKVVSAPIPIAWPLLVVMVLLIASTSQHLNVARKTVSELRMQLERLLEAKRSEKPVEEGALNEEERAVLDAVVAGDGIERVLSLRAITGMTKIRVHHGLEKLFERDFIEKTEKRGEQHAQLTSKGREYVVQNNLDRPPALLKPPTITE